MNSPKSEPRNEEGPYWQSLEFHDDGSVTYRRHGLVSELGPDFNAVSPDAPFEEEVRYPPKDAHRD